MKPIYIIFLVDLLKMKRYLRFSIYVSPDFAGIWSYLSNGTSGSDDYQGQLSMYMHAIRSSLDETLFLEIYFDESAVEEEEYYENLSDLNRKSYLGEVKAATETLGKIYDIFDWNQAWFKTCFKSIIYLVDGKVKLDFKNFKSLC